MSHGGFSISRLFKYLPRSLEGVTILDAGQGRGEVGFYIRAFTGRQLSGFHGQPHIVGVDIHQPHVDFVKNYLPKIYDEVYQLDLANLGGFFGGRRFNISMLNEVVEHVDKCKALGVLDQVEAISDYVLVSTPYGDELNQCYPDTPEFNHVSTWFPEDFAVRGYTVAVEDTLEFGASPIAEAYKLARRVFGTPIQRKIIAIKGSLKKIDV
jgi:SAM-dependent methyltransferase